MKSGLCDGLAAMGLHVFGIFIGHATCIMIVVHSMYAHAVFLYLKSTVRINFLESTQLWEEQ